MTLIPAVINCKYSRIKENPHLRSKNSKIRFLDQFYDFFTKTPDFSPISEILAKNRPYFFVFGDMNLLWLLSDWKYTRLKLNPYFRSKNSKTRFLEPFFDFFGLCDICHFNGKVPILRLKIPKISIWANIDIRVCFCC